MIFEQVTDIKLGTSQVQKVMQGTTQVWPVIKKYTLRSCTNMTLAQMTSDIDIVISDTTENASKPWVHRVLTNSMGMASFNDGEPLPENAAVFHRGTIKTLADGRTTSNFVRSDGKILYVDDNFRFTMTNTGKEAQMWYVQYVKGSLDRGGIGSWKTGYDNSPFIGYEENGTYYGLRLGSPLELVNLSAMDIMSPYRLPKVLHRLVRK